MRRISSVFIANHLVPSTENHSCRMRGIDWITSATFIYFKAPPSAVNQASLYPKTHVLSTSAAIPDISGKPLCGTNSHSISTGPRLCLTSAPHSASILFAGISPLVFPKPPYRPTQWRLWATCPSRKPTGHHICALEVLNPLVHKAWKPSR